MIPGYGGATIGESLNFNIEIYKEKSFNNPLGKHLAKKAETFVKAQVMQINT